MGVHRLGRCGVALGGAIALAFGLAAGLLAFRWTEAGAATPSAAPTIGTSGPIPVPRSLRAAAQSAPAPVAPAARPAPPPLDRTCGDEGRLVRYRVTVGDGLDTSVRAFARAVSDVLCDERGWIGSDAVRFRYDPRGPVRIHLMSAGATERRCMALIGLSVRRMWSCASSSQNQVVLNADRWFEGSPSWPGGVRRYRRMLVNHEVGHILGHGHRSCPAAGKPAPVMMQQSKGTLGCKPNPWPTAAELRATR